jgi:glycosyltransferase involved in cell wall biosynthesis
MNIVIAHELLTMRGGAERVVKTLADTYPDAPIITLLYKQRKLQDWFPENRVKVSMLQLGSLVTTNHHAYLPLFSRAVESITIKPDVDVLLSSSSAFMHGLNTAEHTKHICYVHAPARYLWDRTHEMLKRANQGLLGPVKHWLASTLFHRLRKWDVAVANRPDVLLAASKDVQRRIKLYWGRESQVVYPFVDDYWLENTNKLPRPVDSEYYLIVSSLVRYKQIDIAIKAFNENGKQLIIIGEGSDKKRLEHLAHENINFVGYKESDDLRAYYQHARAVIFPGEEDFGIVPLEAMSQGTPVIAYGRGGALETIEDGTHGVLFHEPYHEAIEQAARQLETMQFDADTLKKQAANFSREIFLTAIDKVVQTSLDDS